MFMSMCGHVYSLPLWDSVILLSFISLFPPFLPLSVLLKNFGTDFKTALLLFSLFSALAFVERSLGTLFGSATLLRSGWPRSFKKISDRYWHFLCFKAHTPFKMSCHSHNIQYIVQGQGCVHVQYVLCHMYQTSHVFEMRQPTAHIWLTFELFRLISCFLYQHSVWQKDQQMCRWMDAQQAKLLGMQTACKQVRDESYRKSCPQTNGRMHGWVKRSETCTHSSRALMANVNHADFVTDWTWITDNQFSFSKFAGTWTLQNSL